MQYKVWFRAQEDADWWFEKLIARGFLCRCERTTKSVVWFT